MAFIDYKKAYDDNNQPQNVQNITWSHKLYRENQKKKNLEGGIDSRRKKLSWSKDPKVYFKEMHYHCYYS